MKRPQQATSLKSQLDEHYDVIVIGGGASGLMCALTAAKRQRKVLVLEGSNKVGKKILMSGGGRCNFTNLDVTAEHFISCNPHFCKSALARYTQWDFIAWVAQSNIEYEERKHGQLFCVHSSKDILSMLLEACAQHRVSIVTDCAVSAVNSQALSTARYELEVNAARVSCESLVIASGGLSIPTLGSSDFGYIMARQFNLPVVPVQAALVPFTFSDSTKALCQRLAGVAVDVELSCRNRWSAQQQTQSFTEAMLFTHRGLSGPAVLQLSSYWAVGEHIVVNLLPYTDVIEALLNAKRQAPRQKLKNYLASLLPKALVEALQVLFWPNQSAISLAEVSHAQLCNIAQQLQHWELKPSGTEGYRTAEVTLGGVDTDAISSKHFEVKTQPGLFFIGEVLDVTGHLGGYNFQWAWSSGYAAGSYV